MVFQKCFFYSGLTMRQAAAYIIPIMQKNVAIIPITGYTIIKKLKGGDFPWNINLSHK